VGGDLLGVIVAIARVDQLVAFERGGMQLGFGRRDQVEIPAGVASPTRRAHIRTVSVSRDAPGYS